MPVNHLSRTKSITVGGTSKSPNATLTRPQTTIVHPVSIQSTRDIGKKATDQLGPSHFSDRLMLDENLTIETF